jgi:hypothetical protein
LQIENNAHERFIDHAKYAQSVIGVRIKSVPIAQARARGGCKYDGLMRERDATPGFPPTPSQRASSAPARDTDGPFFISAYSSKGVLIYLQRQQPLELRRQLLT